METRRQAVTNPKPNSLINRVSATTKAAQGHHRCINNKDSNINNMEKPSSTASRGRKSHKVAIIGAGSVGSNIASFLLLRRIVPTILLVDIDQVACNAQVLDLSDAGFLSNAHIRSATPAEAGQADIIVISAGAKQRSGDSRLDLINRNLKVLDSVMEGMKPIREDAVVLMVANPVDILTLFAHEKSGLPKGQVMGSGTFLDSARLRVLLAEKAGIADTSVQIDVIGEHGDSQVVAWSSARIGSTPLFDVLPLTKDEQTSLAETARDKAYEIINGKGFTSFGVAAVVSCVCESILADQKVVMPISHWIEELGTCLSLPAVIGRGGIVQTVWPGLTTEERGGVEESARRLAKVIKAVK
jgi:L-lactate dehydrogenase